MGEHGSRDKRLIKCYGNTIEYILYYLFGYIVTYIYFCCFINITFQNGNCLVLFCYQYFIKSCKQIILYSKIVIKCVCVQFLAKSRNQIILYSKIVIKCVCIRFSAKSRNQIIIYSIKKPTFAEQTSYYGL